jgi:dihydrolipoamide dehydrogenase
VKHLLVIGAGPGGEAAAKAAAKRGARVTLVEKSLLGGVCLNEGCIPSKTLLEAGRLAHRVKAAAGYAGGTLSIRWDDLQKKKNAIVQTLRDGLAQHLKRLGVTVLSGTARFKDARTAVVNGEDVPFDAAVVAAGSEPFFPEPFPAFRDGILDSTRVLSLPRVPKSLLVVGGGAVGCEFACLFQELGSQVTLLEKTEALLPGEDPAVVRVLHSSFEKRGMKIIAGATVDRLAHEGARWTSRLSAGEDVETEEVLVCVGRRPNAGVVGPEAAGLGIERGRLTVNEFLQTNVPHIYAVGDVNGLSLLAHAASAQAEVAVGHLFGETRAYDNALVPRCLYTWPEVASVGEWTHSAQAKGIETKSRRFFFQASPKAMALDETEGFVQVVSAKADDRLLGAQIVGPHATDLIHVIAPSLAAGHTVSLLRESIFAHPTLSEGIKEALSR